MAYGTTSQARRCNEITTVTIRRERPTFYAVPAAKFANIICVGTLRVGDSSPRLASLVIASGKNRKRHGPAPCLLLPPQRTGIVRREAVCGSPRRAFGSAALNPWRRITRRPGASATFLPGQAGRYVAVAPPLFAAVIPSRRTAVMASFAELVAFAGAIVPLPILILAVACRSLLTTVAPVPVVAPASILSPVAVTVSIMVAVPVPATTMITVAPSVPSECRAAEQHAHHDHGPSYPDRSPRELPHLNLLQNCSPEVHLACHLHGGEISISCVPECRAGNVESSWLRKFA